MRFLDIILTFLCCILLYASQTQARQFCISFGKNTTSNAKLEDILKNEIETLTGSNDGFVYEDKLDINCTHPAISLYGDLRHFNVSNLNKYDYTIFNIKFKESSVSFEIFNLTFQNISLSGGTYNFTGNIGDLFNIFGEGEFWLNMLNFSISANILLDGVKLNATTACIGLDISVDVGSMEGYFNNFMNDPELEEILNRTLLKIAPDAIRIIWKEMFEQKYYDDGNDDGNILDGVNAIITKNLGNIGNDDRFLKVIQSITKDQQKSLNSFN